ncbi:hypothetical protein LCGC14_1872810 [marine sediment metagenome]|uniref:Uncharacterized protein n=1 Tax=marine sediment metagenome TaxID=412755 RepID=A0A0F9J382_9ZZZZ
MISYPTEIEIFAIRPLKDSEELYSVAFFARSSSFGIGGITHMQKDMPFGLSFFIRLVFVHWRQEAKATNKLMADLRDLIPDRPVIRAR